MKTCSKSPVTLLKVMFVTLLPVLEAQEIEVLPVVKAYLGHDVTLPCRLLRRAEVNITLVQWELTLPDKQQITILVFSSTFGVNISEPFLKGKVALEEQTLRIRNVEVGDAGSYTCSISGFPIGSHRGSTDLLVQEQMPLSSGLVSAIVIVVIVLFGIMAAIVYLIFIRRWDAPARQRVNVDTSGAAMAVARPSVLVRDEDVVYSDVKHKRSRDSAVSSIGKHAADDVTYSEVLIFHQPAKFDEMYV